MHDEVFDWIEKEYYRQQYGIELIASENFVSPAVLRAAGSCLTNKYAEGLPGKRFYGGCQFVDEVENLAIKRACQLFGATWANVQPHSGAQANMAVMAAALKPGDKLLGFNLAHGGHLTHGSPVNFSGKLYEAHFYGVNPETGIIDFNQIEDIANRVQPKLIICGASAYAREWDYVTLRQVADKVGALLLADIAHPAGLIATKLLNNPLPHCHFVTTTTHKTLRGPRGGMILMGQDFDTPNLDQLPKGTPKKVAALLDWSVFPGTQGGPLMHTIAAKAVAFKEALSPEYTKYCAQIIANAQALAKALIEKGYQIVSGGTDNHLMLIDLRNKNLTGRAAEIALGKAEITVNKNMIPNDPQTPFVTSGIRIGTPAITTRGLTTEHMPVVANFIDRVLSQPENQDVHQKVSQEVADLMSQYLLQY